MAALTSLVSLASNTTKLEAKTKNNATKIAEIQAKASTAATDLATMQANTTLVSTCAVIASAQKTEDTCDKMDTLSKLVSLAANTTKLDAKTNGNATKAAEIQAKASTAATQLADLQSNTTLTDACATIKTAKADAKG